MLVWPSVWVAGERSTWSPKSCACLMGAARPWAWWPTRSCGQALTGGKYEACRLGDLLFLSGQVGNVPGTRQLARPRGEVHGVPGGHPGLRGDECRLCHVFPEGSTRALDG